MRYEFRHDSLSPRLLQAIGLVVVNWVHIENEINKICKNFKIFLDDSSSIPKHFDARAEFIKIEFNKLFKDNYSECLDEVQLFDNYYIELKEINSLRDDVCHGLPAVRVGKNEKRVECILVESVNRGSRDRAYTIKQLENLPRKMAHTLWKTTRISTGVYEALMAASLNRTHWDHRDGWTQLTKDNRKTLSSLLSGQI